MDRYVVFGHVVGVHIDDRFIKDGRLDTAAMRPIARCGYDEYAVVENVFKMTPAQGRRLDVHGRRARCTAAFAVTPFRHAFYHNSATALYLRRSGVIIAATENTCWFSRVCAADATATAAPTATSDTPERTIVRPTIGLALGGGAARGFAHIGVLRTLARPRHRARHHRRHLDRRRGRRLLCRRPARCHRGLGARPDQRGILGYLDISLAGGGLIGGGRLAARLDEKLGNTPIEALPIRFATIATEVGTGHEIWLTRGRLVDAMRASYALPGIFPPVRSAAAGWSTARWSIRCRCRRRARSAPAW